MSSISFRPYNSADQIACLAIFDANCPEYFAPNERADYARFLKAAPDGYEVWEVDQTIVGACGLIDADSGGITLNWIMIDPNAQGSGVGSAMMARAIQLAQAAGHSLLRIAASHRSAAFFARFGAEEIRQTEDGWGPGMHRVDMELRLPGGT